VFFWFIGTAIVTVGVVFRDPRFDYRLLIVGSVLPIADGLAGSARPLHSVTVSVVLLAVLMVVTAGRKPVRKLLLGLPIGMILHLVFSGAWNDTERFWWPFFGYEFDDAPPPMFYSGVWSLVLEALGLAICVWLWRHNRFGDSTHRAEFMRNGQLDAVPERLG
jgi:hypothetical protein